MPIRRCWTTNVCDTAKKIDTFLTRLIERKWTEVHVKNKNKENNLKNEKNVARTCGNYRSRQALSNAYLVAKIGFDTAENEPSKVCERKFGVQFTKTVIKLANMTLYM